ncbi:Rne/Rng family ribonuclease [Quadrisphaera sp. GCM10027208]|uniref:Rne/Rng family ribonuclease n=1 Tax=Quadrisphaera sp. GCM10027208 TaxID=3273423 RepID=UPI003619FB4F
MTTETGSTGDQSTPEQSTPEQSTPEQSTPEQSSAEQRPRRRRAASRPAGPPQADMPSAGTPTAGTPTAETSGTDTPATDVPDASPAAPAKRPARKRAAKKTAAVAEPAPAQEAPQETAAPLAEQPAADTPAPRKRTTRKRAAAKTAPAASEQPDEATAAGEQIPQPAAPEPDQATAGVQDGTTTGAATPVGAVPATAVLFQPPDPAAAPRRRRAASRPAGPPQVPSEPAASEEQEQQEEQESAGTAPSAAASEVTGPAGQPGTGEDAGTSAGSGAEAGDRDDGPDDGGDGAETRRRRRRRGGRGRRRRSGEDSSASAAETDDDTDDDARDGTSEDTSPGKPKGKSESKPKGKSEGKSQGKTDGDTTDNAGSGVGDEVSDQVSDEVSGEVSGDHDNGDEDSGSSRRRRRRRRRSGEADDSAVEESGRAKQGRKPSDDVTAVKGSTRLEAKRQRRREGRDSGRRRPVITESEFLARRESVERVMVVREREGRTQIAVLEDGVLVEHYVARKEQSSLIGDVYVGRVQNVLPSMEAAFVDIGKGRNAVLYAGEVNWDAAGLEGQPKRIEVALKSGDPVLVQVTKDPVGHKGARLTSQVSLPGRYLVYVPRSSMTGISRKLPDTERNRLKKILRSVLPEDAGVIVRTAAEGASEEELSRDVQRLQAQWEDIEKKAKAVSPPAMLYGEPDLMIKVVRDVFNEDFTKLVVAGDHAWDTVSEYVQWVAPDLAERLERWDGEDDVFAAHRIDEQIAKALERKVWLPSGGSLVIDRTEAMTVVDVNTGKFTGSGGSLEETVTKNNLEAAEEIVRQLRLRDIGGIIVVDFIDMVLESNRDLVLRRLVECLGRDRTKHQVAEVTSLGLVQMTRKRVGQGLLEAFSETCECCNGRGVVLFDEPVEKSQHNGGRTKGEQPGSQQRRKGGVKEVAAATLRAGGSADDAGEVPASAEPV